MTASSEGPAPDHVSSLVARGEIGGRTVQIVESGDVECVRYDLTPLVDGFVRVRTVRSAISPGTEMTLYGRHASNVYLRKRWNEELRLFEEGRPSLAYPVFFGYRAAGEVVESRSPDVPVGTRVHGSWRHTEYTTLPAADAVRQALPDELSWDDGVDISQMAPICLNALAFSEGEHIEAPAVVFGAGPIGLITAQLLRAAGAKTVHVVDRIVGRLSIATEVGFEVLDASAEDVARTLKRTYGAEGVPVVWECTGSTLALQQAIRVPRRRGMVVAVGFYQGDGHGLYLGDEFHHNGIRLVCGQINNLHPSVTVDALRARVLALVATGQLVLGGLPRLTLPVEDVVRAFEALSRPADQLQVALTYD